MYLKVVEAYNSVSVLREEQTDARLKVVEGFYARPDEV